MVNGQWPLEMFKRKYLQMEDPHEITYPPKELIKPPAAQRWMVDNMFDRRRIKFLPTARYTFRVMKKLLGILEEAMEDPEEDEISDDLTACFTEVLARADQDEMASIQERCPVTYTAPVSEENAVTVTIIEAPLLLACGGQTGNRTWAAALYLGSFLYNNGRHLIENRVILELGSGLGFVSILCGKHLRAKHVLMTDGSDAVMHLAKDNVALNGVDEVVESNVLLWGATGVHDIFRSGRQSMQLDLVLGADILYEPEDFPALMSTLRDLFARFPYLQILISNVVRSEFTLESFLDACSTNSLHVERLAIPTVPEEEQIGFFHSTFDPVHIYLITSPRKEHWPDGGIHDGAI
ncbi:MAG: hypothetical protein Q9207_007590 [Kuettlingeria erythrocarpa]